MNYSLFLFAKLLESKFHPQYEYDLQYEDTIRLFEEYEGSKFNTPELPEYECIELFLEDRKSFIQALIKARTEMIETL